ncbi:MAG: protein kinase [Candidatus Obscuribacterales bacterium]|nr:protein kinase [Candidatus Obscuribacterales bacterium]
MKERPSQFQEPSVDVQTNICKRCGRVKRAVKSGSLTSWIFADSRCQCQISMKELELKVIDSQPGTVQFQDFEIQTVIGHGGMGSVYKVLEKSSGRTLAIKLMKDELVKDSVSVKRFEQEVQACMDLSHPNLIDVHGFGRTSDGQPYLIMDYLDGKNLQELLAAEGLLEVDRALAIFISVCSAISAAHEQGIVHRDLKPSNIMIVKDETIQEEKVKVVDFGIARVVNADPKMAQSLTSTGEIFGSPLYMSPEQCKGEEVDSRSDIYSLGCVFYETLSGKPPFQGKNPIQTILKHLNEDEPESLVSKKLGVSQALNNVLLKCLAKDPRDRYANVDELRRDLKYLRAGLEPNVKVVRSKRKRPKEQRILRFLQICLATLIGITVAYFVFLYTFRPADINSLTQAINQNPNDAESYFSRAKLYADDGQSREALSDLNMAIGIQPNFYLALKHRARIHTNLKEYQKAIADATAAIALFPKLEMAYIERARTYWYLHDYENAIKDCSKSLELNPKNWRNNRIPALYNRAECYVTIGKYQPALKDCQEALSLMNDGGPDPRLTRRDLQNTMARALLGLNRKEDALKAANAAVLCDGKSYEALYERATVLESMAKYSEADKDLTALVEMIPQSEFYYRVRAQNRMMMGKMTEAIKDITTAIELKPSDADLYSIRACMYMGMGKDRLANVDLDGLLEVTNWKGEPAIYAAITQYYCYRKVGDTTSAKRILKEYPPKLGVKYGWAADIFKYLEGKISAKQLLEKAKHNEKYITEARSFIGMSEYLDGKRDGSTVQFRWPISFVSNEPEILIGNAFLRNSPTPNVESDKK